MKQEINVYQYAPHILEHLTHSGILVTAKVGDQVIDLGTYTGATEQTIPVAGANTTSNIEIVVEDVTPPAVNP